jgi:hypothetical protein
MPALGCLGQQCVAYKVLGDVALRRSDPRAALIHYGDALGRSSGSWRRLVQLSQASAMLAAGDTEGARSIAAATSTFASDAEKAMAARLRGNVLLAAGNADEAIEEFRKYGAMIAGDEGTYHRVWAHEGESRALERKGEARAAREALLKALDEAERERARFRSEEFKTAMFGEMQEIFARAARAFVKAGDYERAFDIAERGRSRALVDSVRGRVRVGDTFWAEPLGTAITAHALVKSLPEGDTLVVNLVDLESTSVWILTGAGVRHVALPVGRASLSDSVLAFRQAILKRSPGARQLSAGLHSRPRRVELGGTLSRPGV